MKGMRESEGTKEQNEDTVEIFEGTKEQREGTEEKVESTDGQIKGTEDHTEEEIRRMNWILNRWYSQAEKKFKSLKVMTRWKDSSRKSGKCDESTEL
ncbi:hypothetical protein Tco_1173956 [Tanacetum coccineum]